MSDWRRKESLAPKTKTIFLRADKFGSSGSWLIFSEKGPFFRRRTSCLNYVWPPSAAGRKEKVVKDVLPPPSLLNIPSLFLLSWVRLGQLSVQISLVSGLALLRSKNKFFRSSSSDEEEAPLPPAVRRRFALTRKSKKVTLRLAETSSIFLAKFSIREGKYILNRAFARGHTCTRQTVFLPSLFFSRRPADHRRFIFNWGPPPLPPFSLISIRIWPQRKRSRISLLFGTDSPSPTYAPRLHQLPAFAEAAEEERAREEVERERRESKRLHQRRRRDATAALCPAAHPIKCPSHAQANTQGEKGKGNRWAAAIGGPPPFGFPRVGVVVRSHLSLSSHSGAPRARRGEETEERNE